MKIDMSQQLRTLDGKPILTAKDEESEREPMLLSQACVNALLAQLEDDKRQTGEDKLKNYELARKVHGKGEVELESQDVAKIKERVGKVFGPVIVGQAWEMLEGQQ